MLYDCATWKCLKGEGKKKNSMNEIGMNHDMSKVDGIFNN